jgi:hypothetical protein
MSSRCHELAVALACSLALSLPAAAQTAPAQHDMPTGDVWITPGGSSTPPVAAATSTGIPTGDVWLTAEDDVRTVHAERRRDAVDAEPVKTGSVR